MAFGVRFIADLILNIMTLEFIGQRFDPAQASARFGAASTSKTHRERILVPPGESRRTTHRLLVLE
jgi:hypothetical protein